MKKEGQNTMRNDSLSLVEKWSLVPHKTQSNNTFTRLDMDYPFQSKYTYNSCVSSRVLVQLSSFVSFSLNIFYSAYSNNRRHEQQQ